MADDVLDVIADHILDSQFLFGEAAGSGVKVDEAAGAETEVLESLGEESRAAADVEHTCIIGQRERP